MTVAELIAKLQEFDGDRIVIVTDHECTNYSPIHDVWDGAYKAETTWMGEFGLETLTPEDEEEGYSEEDVVDGVPAIVIVPIG